MTRLVVIADSSPLIALAIIDQLDLLPGLFRRVVIPPAVWEEITVQGAGLHGAHNPLKHFPTN